MGKVTHVKHVSRPTVPVSERALVQRINRALAQKHGKFGQSRIGMVQLKKTKGGRAIQDLGEYYELDVYRNTIRSHHVDIEKLARELGALEKWEGRK
jgi:hypothetical protein